MYSEWKLTTEVNIFTSSVDFQNAPSTCTPALQIVMENGAHSPCYYGAQTEAATPTIGYNFVHWNSQQAHMDVTDNPDVFPSLQKALAPSLYKPPTIKLYHVIFSNDPVTGFTQPYTEVTSLFVQKPPMPSSRETVKGLLSQIASKVGTQFVFGPTYEDGNRFIAICGQPSAEGSWVNDSKVTELCKTLFTLVKMESDNHTALSSYAKS